ncbi:exported hypothetical protein [Acidobacteriia bacterium SbA2]|nr:exported hypothetical protein [Acidobacteriia bacterium SbA2]
MSRTCAVLCAFVVAGFFLLPLSTAQTRRSQKFQPPEGTLTAGLRETERHRVPLPELRIGRSQGSPQTVTFWVHVNPQGGVIEVREFKTDAPWPLKYSTGALVEAVRNITYRPFFSNGAAAEAWVQDEVQVGVEPAPSVLSGGGATFPTPVERTGFSIQLSRSGCYGSCPSYSVIVHGDGKVDFDGKSFVAIPGDHEARIEPEAAARLLERFRTADFFGLKDEYRAGVTDNPTYCLQLAIGPRKKTIIDYVGSWVGMPESVSELEDAVDETAGTDRWVSGGPQTLAAMREAGIEPSSQAAGEILLHAVKEGKAEAVRTLLAAGAPVRTKNANGGNRSLLTIASFIRDRESQHEVFRALLLSAEVREDEAGMQDALGRAAEDGNVDVARTLISAGADPTHLFFDTYQNEGKPDQTYLMRAAASGVWEMLDDALSRPHDIHAVDSKGRSALAHVLWSAPPMEDIFPLVDRLMAAGAGKKELTTTLADACDSPQWQDGLIKRGADPAVCTNRRK